MSDSFADDISAIVRARLPRLAPRTEFEWENTAVDLTERIANVLTQALTDQRARYEAVADELDMWRENATRYAAEADPIEAARARGRVSAYDRSAASIREVSA